MSERQEGPERTINELLKRLHRTPHRDGRGVMARKLPPDTRELWQIEQGKRCPCMGHNEMCGCQNTQRNKPDPIPSPYKEGTGGEF